jgi:hypothetical protein
MKSLYKFTALQALHSIYFLIAHFSVHYPQVAAAGQLVIPKIKSGNLFKEEPSEFRDRVNPRGTAKGTA